MASFVELDRIYTERLAGQPEGHALYRNYSATVLKPGACGYFDVDGDWKGIIQLTDSGALEKAGYKLLEEIMIEVEPGYTKWKPKTSDLVKGYRVDATATANVAPGASAGCTVAFKSETDQGAVLITDPPIKHYLAQHETLLLDWMVSNTSKLIKNCKEVEKYGGWIITKTYTTKRCARAVLRSKDSEVTMAVEVDVADIAKASPSASWWNRSSDSSWVMHSNKSGVVVFMRGIQFKPRTIRKSQLKPVLAKKDQKIWRSGEVSKVLEPITVPVEEGSEDPLMLELSPVLWPEAVKEISKAN